MAGAPITRRRAKIDKAPETHGANGQINLSQGIQGISLSDFRLMWFGACTSSIGTWMQIVAQGWLIYRLSHSAFLLALDQFLANPNLLFSLIGGVVADRTERRKILLVSQYMQMTSALLLTILVATERFTSGTFSAFRSSLDWHRPLEALHIRRSFLRWSTGKTFQTPLH